MCDLYCVIFAMSYYSYVLRKGIMTLRKSGGSDFRIMNEANFDFALVGAGSAGREDT